jgi:6-phosphogluconolactonase
MSPADVAQEVVASFERSAQKCIADDGRFSVAVPGGSVAELVFPKLVKLTSVPWPLVDVTWVDERVVPETDPDSNVGVARRLWLDRLPSPGPRVLAPLPSGDPEFVAKAWAAALVSALGHPPRLNVAILGVGPDGHVASLFPGHPALERPGWTIGVNDSPKPPPARVSLSLVTFREADEIWVVATGSNKATVIADARTRADSPLPLAHVVRSAKRVRWFLDDDASRA